MEKIPYTVIGGGICGILTALKLKEKYPDSDVLLLEQEPYVGHHNTTRNSGVLHAGIYYKTGSLKHKLCMAGYEQWLNLARQHKLPINICGKYIIATSEAEEQKLAGIFLNASKNGVEALRKLTTDDLGEIHDYCFATSGFISPKTGILDISASVNKLRDELLRRGVIILMNTKVLNLKSQNAQILVESSTDKFATNHFFNCAGAGAVNLRKKLGLLDIENQFIKGNYLKLNKPYYNKRLIYPVPQENLHSLGVHTSFHLDGIVRFGPNAEPTNEVNYINSDANIDIMYPAIIEKFKNIKKSDLSSDYTGVRTKILKNGNLFSDFLIQSETETKIPGYHEALGIESPGMTAAPAIADFLVSKLL